MTLTPAGELAAATITSCAVCQGRVWCPSCEDRRDVLATAIEAIVARHVATSLTEAADRIDAAGSVCINAHGSQCVGGIAYRDAARTVRAAIPTT